MIVIKCSVLIIISAVSLITKAKVVALNAPYILPYHRVVSQKVKCNINLEKNVLSHI